MIPLGYMLKVVAPPARWIAAANVVDVYSVADCVSDSLDDYLPLWRHNGHDLFDSAEIAWDVADALGADRSELTLFYYECHPEAFDNWSDEWEPVVPAEHLGVNVKAPAARTLVGYDLVAYQTGREHSPLSCQPLAKEVPVNSHCLLDSLEAGLDIARSGKLADYKPGPYRFVAVYLIP